MSPRPRRGCGSGSPGWSSAGGEGAGHRASPPTADPPRITTGVAFPRDRPDRIGAPNDHSACAPAVTRSSPARKSARPHDTGLTRRSRPNQTTQLLSQLARGRRSVVREIKEVMQIRDEHAAEGYSTLKTSRDPAAALTVYLAPYLAPRGSLTAIGAPSTLRSGRATSCHTPGY